MEKRAFSPEEVAQLLGISKMTVYREIRRKKLPCARLGRIYIITRPDLQQWLGVERVMAILGAKELPAGGRHNEPIMDAESYEWIEAAAQDTADRLADIKADLPADELEAWNEAMAQSAKPARYVPGKGVVVEEE